MKATLVVTAFALTPILAASPLAPEQEPDAADRTMLQMRIAGAVLESYEDAHGRLPDLGDTPVDAARLARALGPAFGHALPDRDGWGNDLVYAVDPDSYEITSPGADGRIDPPPRDASDDSPDFGPAVPPDDDPARDIVYSDGDFDQRPPPREFPGERAMKDMREIALALAVYESRKEAYPGPTRGLWTIDTFAADLEQVYPDTLPRVDPWGHPYLIWSDTTSYLIVCTAADGEPDVPYKEPGALTGGIEDEVVPTFTAEADIVYADGRFVRFPIALDDE